MKSHVRTFINMFALLFLPGIISSGQFAFAQVLTREGHLLRISDLALERTSHSVRYDPSYRAIPYPGGDVPDSVGVCTDLIVRVYRGIGVDLQKEVHEDMKKNFGAYPRHWGLSGPDPNIDHRRVPNLATFFSRQGAALPVSTELLPRALCI